MKDCIVGHGRSWENIKHLHTTPTHERDAPDTRKRRNLIVVWRITVGIDS